MGILIKMVWVMAWTLEFFKVLQISSQNWDPLLTEDNKYLQPHVVFAVFRGGWRWRQATEVTQDQNQTHWLTTVSTIRDKGWALYFILFSTEGGMERTRNGERETESKRSHLLVHFSKCPPEWQIWAKVRAWSWKLNPGLSYVGRDATPGAITLTEPASGEVGIRVELGIETSQSDRWCSVLTSRPNTTPGWLSFVYCLIINLCT